MSTSEALRPHLDGLQRNAMIVGVLGLVGLAAGFMMNQEQFWRSYLIGFLFWAGICLGSLGILMLHHMVGGGWGVAIRRGLEAAIRTLPLVFLLSLPLIAGMHHLYEWTHADVVAKDPILTHKAAYLNTTGFIVRLLAYFGIWILLSFLLNKYSAEQESAGYWAVRKKLQRVSAPGLVIFTLAATFASFDWIMSIEPHWFSTIYGALTLIGWVLATFAFMIMLTKTLSQQPAMEGTYKKQTFHDLGNLLLAFTMFFAYLEFSQFLIIYSANLPEEIVWYLKRMQGPWGVLGGLLIATHFAIPFLILLFRRNKKHPAQLAAVAAWILVMRMAQTFWAVQPGFAHGMKDGVPVVQGLEVLDVAWTVAALAGIGGLWVWFFFFQLKRRSLEPLPLS